jgi:uncharacterized membrane protein (DUF106 family)
MLHALRHEFHFKARQTARRVLGMLFFSVVMYAFVRTAVLLLSMVLNPYIKVTSAVIIVIALPIGVAVYAYLVLKTHLADMVLGARVAGIRTRLHIK